MTATGPRREIVSFVALAYGISWAMFLAGWSLSGFSSSPEDFYLWVMASAFGPGLAGAWLSWRDRNLGTWLRSFIKVRAGWKAYALTLLAVPLTALALTILGGFEANTKYGDASLIYLTLFPVVILNGAVTALLGAGPLGEEGGWRGYLLPRLLKSSGTIKASVILGIIWSFWHLPIMAVSAEWRSGLSFALYLPIYTVGVIMLSILLTRVWQLSGGSIFLCVWLHGIVNVTGSAAFGSLWISDAHGPLSRVLFFSLALSLSAGLALIIGRRPKIRVI